MGLNDELAKASEIMARYNMHSHDQVEVIRILVDAGVEKCLDEQQRIRDEKDALVSAAFSGLVH